MSEQTKAWAVVGLVVLVLAGCTAEYGENPRKDTNYDFITIWHDDDREVTCWIYHSGYAGGMSCLPDHQLTPTKETP